MFSLTFQQRDGFDLHRPALPDENRGTRVKGVKQGNQPRLNLSIETAIDYRRACINPKRHLRSSLASRVPAEGLPQLAPDRGHARSADRSLASGWCTRWAIHCVKSKKRGLYLRYPPETNF